MAIFGNWFVRPSNYIMAGHEMNSLLETRIFRNREVFGRGVPFYQIIDQKNEKMQDRSLRWTYDKGVDLEFAGGLSSSPFSRGSLRKSKIRPILYGNLRGCNMPLKAI